MSTPWFSLAAAWLADERVRDIGDDHGPAGPLVFVAILGACKRDGLDGRVTIRRRWLARETFTTQETVSAVLSALASNGLLTIANPDVPDAEITIPNWKKYQHDPTASQRMKRYRARLKDRSLCEGEPRNQAESRMNDTAALRGNRNGTVLDIGQRTEEQEQKSTVEQKRSTELDPVVIVFDAWRDATGKRDAKLTGTAGAKRRRRIVAALAEYPLDHVIDAVKGWRHFPHNRGENDRGRPFNDIDLVLRDAEHIELFRDAERSHRDADTQVRDDVAAIEQRIKATLAATARTA